jgi:hypothetical protein
MSGVRRVARIVRDCTHGGRHPHGTPACYSIDGCRCDPCTDSKVVYDTNRRKQIAYGRWESAFVAADAARAHALKLRAQGVGYRRIAARAGLRMCTVQRILRGAARISRSTEKAILSLPLEQPLADGARVDSTGARRRVQALAVGGWSIVKIAAEVGVSGQTLWDILREVPCNAATASKVKAAYDRLWSTPPRELTPAEKGSASRTRNWAASKGWAPPLAWDDDTIDDPAAEPYRPDEDTARVPGRPGKVTPEFLEDLEWLRATGVAPKDAAERLGIRHDSLLVALRRHGEKELLEWAAGSQRMPISSNVA